MFLTIVMEVLTEMEKILMQRTASRHHMMVESKVSRSLSIIDY